MSANRVPSRLIHWISHQLTCLTVRLWINPKFNVRKNPAVMPLPRGPFIMVSNHGTFFDPWLIGSLSSQPIHIMCNDDAFRSPSSARYLHAIGAYPKKKGAHDFKAMKDTLRRLSGGWGIAIFPEGQTTWDGASQLIYSGLEKLVTRQGSPWLS